MKNLMRAGIAMLTVMMLGLSTAHAWDANAEKKAREAIAELADAGGVVARADRCVAKRQGARGCRRRYEDHRDRDPERVKGPGGTATEGVGQQPGVTLTLERAQVACGVRC